MSFSMMFQAVKKSVTQYPAAYEAARAKHAALTPYATAKEVLDALAASSPLSYEARDAIVLALITEQQTKAHPLWHALLLAAFEPMLRRLRGRVRHAEHDEIEQRMLIAFLEAVQKTRTDPPPSFLTLHLRRETARAVFGSVRRDRDPCEVGGVDMDRVVDPRTDPLPGDVDAVAARELARIAAEETDGAERDMLLATCGLSEKLPAYIARTHPELSAKERGAMYLRLQRQRHRVLSRIRARLEDKKQGGVAAA
jgi:hypothetical protein